MKKRVTKIFSTLLSLLIVASTATALGCDNSKNEDLGTWGGGEVSEIASLWSVGASERYMQNEEVDNIDNKPEFNFVAIRGETESGQVMIKAKKYIKGFNLTAGDLTIEGGSETISKDNIKVFAERYHNVYSPFRNESQKASTTYEFELGMYPDALIPIENFKKKREDRIAEGNNQGLWVEFNIPADTKAGTYKGQLTLTLGADDAEQLIDVTIKVYDIVMPEEVHSRSALLVWWERISKGEVGNYTASTMDLYYEFILSKRITPDSSPTGKYATNLDYYEVAALDPRVTYYELNAGLVQGMSYVSPSTPSNKTEADAWVANNIQTNVTKLEDALKKVINRNLQIINEAKAEIEALPDGEQPSEELVAKSQINLLKKLLIPYLDEPAQGYGCDNVRNINLVIWRVKNSLCETYADAFEKYPFLKESLMHDVQHIVAASALEHMVKLEDDYVEGDPTTWHPEAGLNLWCPEMYKWQTHLDFFDERLEKGEQLWWYQCTSASPAPSYQIESILMNMRLMSWQQYQFGIEGWLYWDTVNWKADPYNDICFPESNWPATEGIFLYPGTPYGITGPVSSIRFENVSQGQEDYEYLWMLENYLKANNIDITMRELLTKLNSPMVNGNVFIKEDAQASTLEKNRLDILEILNAFATNDVTTAVNLLNAIVA